MATKSSEAEKDEPPSQTLRKRIHEKQTTEKKEEKKASEKKGTLEKKEEKKDTSQIAYTTTPDGTRQRVRLIPRNDGKEGYYIIPVWQPSMWFTKNTERPLFSYTVNVNPLFWALVLFGFLLRFWRIDFPPYVIFDEVHFGKFASYYLTRTFFFDVHPPLGKLIFAGIGYWNGFNGSFLFSSIGDAFPQVVPYVVMRGASGLAGALLIPTVYQIMKELGYSHRAALLAGFFTLLDNSLQIQSRVIMLDSFVILFTYLSVLGYLKFYHCRAIPYSRQWHGWLAVTGLCLGILLGVKYTGLLTLGCVGLLALCDLWQIVADLAVDKWPEPNPPLLKDLLELLHHMLFRGLYLLGIPMLMSFGLFYAHFAVLTNAGPGNAFVSQPFQNTLEGTPPSDPVVDIPTNATLLRYNTSMLLRLSDMSCWLHSHKDLYPLKYPDGRGSSYQQQVTCYEFKDKNNYWIIQKPDSPNDTSPVRNKDVVQFFHAGTEKLLNSHDVAAPLTPANQEVAGYINYSSKFVPYLSWRLEVLGMADGDPVFWSPGEIKLKIVHVQSGQALGSTGKRLPEWGFQQYEVVTDKAVDSASTKWSLDSIKKTNATEEQMIEEEELRNRSRSRNLDSQKNAEALTNTTYSFWEKYFEMQQRMLSAHGSLGDHQFGATPRHWPLLGKTLPYWLDATDNSQVTLIGNPLLWWSGTGAVVLFIAITVFYLLRKKRRIHDLPSAVFEQWWSSGGVLFVSWLAHYLPYFLLSRVLFLHHYLPALSFKFMIMAAVWDHGYYWALRFKWAPRIALLVYYTGLFLHCSSIFASFMLFAPFSFGYPALSSDQIKWRQWVETWDLLFRGG